MPARSARRFTYAWEARIFSKRSIWSQLLLALGASATIVVAANVSRPIYLNREPLGAKILPARAAVDSAALRAPWMRGTTAIALSTPQFLLDRELFAMDLLRTGHVSRPQRLIALPLAVVRQRERGYNQALEIARVIEGRTGIEILSRGLSRVRATPPQAALPWKERAKNVRGAFACEVDLSGLTVAVVDDVMTTGASLAEAAKVLKTAGAARVENWVVARTLPPDVL